MGSRQSKLQPSDGQSKQSQLPPSDGRSKLTQLRKSFRKKFGRSSISSNTMAQSDPNKKSHRHKGLAPIPPISANTQNKLISADDISVHSQSDDKTKATQKTNPPELPSYQHHKPQIVAIGNPGSGKSTILNALAGQILFKSGISIGHGLTNKLDVKKSNGQKFIDTPGVADDKYQKFAAEALTNVFYEGGRMKVLFFVSQEAGRIVTQDVTTMKLVLESVPQIGRNYGIIVNKIPVNVLSQLSDETNYSKLVVSLYASIKDEFKNKNLLLVPLNNNLDDMNNALLQPADINEDLMSFIDDIIPEVYIMPGEITQIRVDNFEQLSQQVEDLEAELKKNQERQMAEREKLIVYLQNVEKENVKEHEETLKRNEEQLQKMKNKIRDINQGSEIEMTGSKERSEIKKLKSEIEQLQEVNNKLKSDQTRMLKQNSEQEKAKEYGQNTDFNMLDLFNIKRRIHKSRKYIKKTAVTVGANAINVMQGGGQTYQVTQPKIRQSDCSLMKRQTLPETELIHL